MGKPSLCTKGGYQPVSTITGVPKPPNTGSNVKKENIKVILKVTKTLNTGDKNDRCTT